MNECIAAQFVLTHCICNSLRTKCFLHRLLIFPSMQFFSDILLHFKTNLHEKLLWSKIENRFHNFTPTPVKLMERWAKCMSQLLKSNIGPASDVYFGGRYFMDWDIMSLMVRKNSRKRMAFRLSAKKEQTFRSDDNIAKHAKHIGYCRAA